MRSDEIIRNLKIVVLIAVALAIVGAVLYLIYGFTILWQAMAAAIITGFLLMVLIFVVVSIYLWTRNLLLKREVKKYEMELKYCREELKKNYSNQDDNRKLMINHFSYHQLPFEPVQNLHMLLLLQLNHFQISLSTSMYY